jgi:hypothetical protein
MTGVNRIHGVGQIANVVCVCKFVVTNSVEGRTVGLRNRKQFVMHESYNGKDDKEGDSSDNIRLGLEEFKMILRR